MATTTKRGKKLALKRETLRKLDQNELQQAAGGLRYTDYCAGGGGGAIRSGGCESLGCLNALQLDYVVQIKYYG